MTGVSNEVKKASYDRESCIELLNKCAEELLLSGEDRFPKKSDFMPEEVSAIKAFLGPWPRALEAAGLKEPPEVTSKDKNEARRIRAKRKHNSERKTGGSQGGS